ncbi:MAG: lysophospholipase [Ideonella sp. MAG2]|nr:MAG: lysophospholipase [Ideonella sp. MAG2]
MIAKLALAPVLLWQGRLVRRSALRLPEAAGPRQGVEEPEMTFNAEREPLRLTVLGDSSAAGVGVAHQRHALAQPLAAALAHRLARPVAWRLLAQTGHTAEQALAQLQAEAPEPTDWLLVVVGVNDAVAQTPASRFAHTLDAIDTWGRAHLGLRHTLHSALPPMDQFPLLPWPLRSVLGQDASRLDAAARSRASCAAGRHHAPLPTLPAPAAQWMAEDGFHPGRAGYAAWAEHLAGFIAQVDEGEVDQGLVA